VTQINPVHATPFHLFKTHLNIILPSMPGSCKWISSSGFPTSPLPHMCCMFLEIEFKKLLMVFWIKGFFRVEKMSVVVVGLWHIVYLALQSGPTTKAMFSNKKIIFLE
jgi:hypothetical protein